MTQPDEVERKQSLRSQQLRRALEFALEHSDSRSVTSALLGALGVLIEDSVDARSFEMAKDGLMGLVRKSPRERAAANAWHAQRHGCDAGQDVVAILELSKAVELAAHLYSAPGGLFATGDAAVEALRQDLVERFGSTVPVASDLGEWISRLGKPKRHGGLTLAGVVARIVHGGRLLGARGDKFGNTLSRIELALKRVANRAKEQEKRLFNTRC